MREYPFPLDIPIRDNLFGGKATLKQVGYIGFNLLLFLYIFFMDTGYILRDDFGDAIGIYPMKFAIRLLIFLSYLVFSLFFAFKRIDDYDLDTYLIGKIRYNKENKVYKYNHSYYDEKN